MKPFLPRISVLIPAYNEEQYILKTLQAIRVQDYPNFEVLVVDNASTDGTAGVVQSFIDREGEGARFRLLHETRRGTQAARECGRKAATGEVIAQLDADCLPPPHWLRTGAALLQSRSVAAVAGPYDYFDSPFFVRTLTFLSQAFLLQPLNKAMQLFGRGGILIGGNAFLWALVLERSGGYNTDLTFYGDDVDIARKAGRFGQIIFTGKTVVKSSSRRYNASGFWQVQARYSRAFWQSLFAKGISQQESIELFHPR